MSGKYDRIELIGSGTFGNVYLVRSASGTSYVLKEVLLTSMSPSEKNQALTEVTVLARCKHKNIIRYKEAMLDEQRGMLCIVMEYAEHGDMYAAIKRQQGVYFPEIDVLSWFVQITLALQYIHNQNILHRDLKTQNIFLGADKLVKVGDFGIARVLKTEKELATTAIGTPYYLSPEICKRKPYNCKSDIWALGCVLFEIASLSHPFQGQNFHELVIAILNVEYKELPSHCSPVIEDLIEILLKANPEKRPSTSEILAIPSLQPHIERYFTLFSPATYLGLVNDDDFPSLRAKNVSRRFSSDDVLSDVTKVAATVKRRSSACVPSKGSSIAQRLSCRTSLASKKTKVSCTPHKEGTISVQHLCSSNDFEGNFKNISNSLSMSPTTNLDLKPKESPMKVCKSRTYTLFKKAIEKGEQLIGKSPCKKKSQTTASNETDNGYYTSERYHQERGGIEESSSGTGARKKLTMKVSENSGNFKTASSEISSISDSGGEVFFSCEKSVKEMHDASRDTSSCSSGTVHCPHSAQCFHCMLDILWRNRIRRSGDIDEKERLKLKKKLQFIFGVERFDGIYQVLLDEWTKTSLDANCLTNDLVHRLSYEERQFFPLIVQLIQLDLVNSIGVRF